MLLGTDEGYEGVGAQCLDGSGKPIHTSGTWVCFECEAPVTLPQLSNIPTVLTEEHVADLSLVLPPLVTIVTEGEIETPADDPLDTRRIAKE